MLPPSFLQVPVPVELSALEQLLRLKLLLAYVSQSLGVTENQPSGVSEPWPWCEFVLNSNQAVTLESGQDGNGKKDSRGSFLRTLPEMRMK